MSNQRATVSSLNPTGDALANYRRPAQPSSGSANLQTRNDTPSSTPSHSHNLSAVGPAVDVQDGDVRVSSDNAGPSIGLGSIDAAPPSSATNTALSPALSVIEAETAQKKGKRTRPRVRAKRKAKREADEAEKGVEEQRHGAEGGSEKVLDRREVKTNEVAPNLESATSSQRLVNLPGIGQTVPSRPFTSRELRAIRKLGVAQISSNPPTCSTLGNVLGPPSMVATFADSLVKAKAVDFGSIAYPEGIRPPNCGCGSDASWIPYM
ncbi:hypothetical protein FRB99_005024 [Tulasnella sp. 403]|nr:hypothetical protein FRB99_005024 [Tulasnella sp. 403]